MQDLSPSKPLTGRRVLVTGGAGFIGASTTRALLARGAEVVVADDFSVGSQERLPTGDPGLTVLPVDVAAPGAMAGLLGEFGALHAVVHLAARVGVARVLSDPEGCWREHVAMGRELLTALQACAPAQRPRLLAASTSEVYADGAGALDEEAPVRSLAGRGRWAYAASKLAVERLLDASAHLWPTGEGPVHLRFFNVVGPGQDMDGGMVLPRFVQQALAGEPLTVHGDGRQTRTFAHVDDVAADLTELVARGHVPAGPLNLGGAASCTIEELAHAVVRHAGSDSSVSLVDPTKHVSPRFEAVRLRRPNLSRAQALGLGLRARSLDEIVEATLAAARAAV
ncbi:MAG: NAD-dependent epimerase/dehydratase family protein [Planctomycetota bacterium]|nr:NAD-dependent epimerase/dehydratase family protein [Planctomycetota bacterium]